LDFGRAGLVIGGLIVLSLLVFVFYPPEKWGETFQPQTNPVTEQYNRTPYQDEDFSGLCEGHYDGTFLSTVQPLMQNVSFGAGHYIGYIKIDEKLSLFDGTASNGFFDGRVFSGNIQGTYWSGNISGTVYHASLNGTILTKAELPLTTEKHDPMISYILIALTAGITLLSVWFYYNLKSAEEKLNILSVPQADELTRPQLREKYDIYVKRLIDGQVYLKDKTQIAKLAYETDDNDFCIVEVRRGEITALNPDVSAEELKDEFAEKGFVQTSMSSGLVENRRFMEKPHKRKLHSRVTEDYVSEGGERETEE